MERILALIWLVFAIAWTAMFASEKKKYEKYRWIAPTGMIVTCMARYFL